VLQNTALQPAGTSYKVSVWPGFAQTSSFVWYAIGAGPVDLSTVVPTLAGLPAYGFVDTFSTQTINGNKTFAGTVTILVALVLPGASSTFIGTGFISASPSPAQTGIFRVASGDLALCWRNNANTNDLCFTKTAGDALQFNGANVGTGGTVTSVGLTVPSWLTVSGSPVTTSGTLAVSATGGQGGNQFVATPCGSAGGVALRILCSSDFPGGLTIPTPILTSPTINTSLGNGTGVQTGTSGGVSMGANAETDVTVNWGTNFADTNYRAICTLDGMSASLSDVFIGGVRTKNVGSVVVSVNNNIGSPITRTVNCVGIHP
jgi:hypothetical protein